MILLGNHCFIRTRPGLLGRTCLVPQSKLLLRLRRRMCGKGTFTRVVSQFFSRVVSLLHFGVFIEGSGSIFLNFPGDAELVPRSSESEDLSTGVDTDGQLKGRCCIVGTRRLVLLAEGPSKALLRLATVRIKILSCWSRRCLMEFFFF